LADFDAVVFVLFLQLGAGEAVVRDLAVRHPDRKNTATGDAAVDAWFAATLPASACVDELAIMDLGALHRERPDAGPEDVVDAQVVKVEVLVAEAKDRAVQLRAAQGQVRNFDIGGLVLKADQVGAGVHALGFHFGVGQGFQRWLPRGFVGDDRLAHADTAQSHPGFKFERRGQFKGASGDVDGCASGGVADGGVEFGGGFDGCGLGHWDQQQDKQESFHPFSGLRC